MLEIKEITDETELENSVKVIGDSFKTVAAELKLNRDNCPTHPSLITLPQLNEMRRKGLKLFGLFEDEMQVGFVAVEKKKDKVLFSRNWLCCPNTGKRLRRGINHFCV